MTSQTAADRCYRHPDRVSWVLCHRCGRTICGECQVQAPVGVRCPECVREERAAMSASAGHRPRALAGGTVGGRPSASHGLGRGVRRWLGQPAPVTIGIIALTAVVGVLQVLPGDVAGVLGYALPYSLSEPWRFVTHTLVHAGPLHFAFNMLVLFMVGPAIEQRIGKLPFLASYLVLAIGAAVAVAWFTPSALVVGASGAIFGLFGMAIGMQRMLGRVDPQLLLIVGINLAITFLFSNISWPAHVGGLLLGVGIGLLTGRLDRRMPTSRAAWIAVAAAFGVALVAFGALLAVLL